MYICVVLYNNITQNLEVIEDLELLRLFIFSQRAVTPEPKQRSDVGKILSRRSRRKTHNEACKRANQVYERINKFWSTME